MKAHTEITATNLAKSLSDVLNRVRYRGEHFLIERNGEPLAHLEPVSIPPSLSLRSLASGMKGVNLPGEGFADDLEAAQASQPLAETPEWP